MTAKKTKLALFSLIVLASLGTSVVTTNSQQVDATTTVSQTTVVSNNYAAQAIKDLAAAAQSDNFAAFDKTWAYSGSDLGFSYSSTGTTFKVWAPTATSVQLISYGKTTNPNAAQVSATAMSRGTTASPTNHASNTIGVWSVKVAGDQNGLVYAYKITFADGTVSDFPDTTYGTLSTKSVTNITNDPYSIATTQGGSRSVVVSPASVASNLQLAQGQKASWRVASPTQAIVDELHIRNFTSSPTSGVSAANRGKYLGVIQSGTKDPNTGSPTGLDYLKKVGFNYVQLMPVSQYASVNESGKATTAQPNVFNWGYDPENEMVPEGEYASDSVNPLTRIKEMKQMVQGLHDNGIGVIMDIVLNHVYNQNSSAFEKTVPGYYFQRHTVSGCGNDTASNHEMFQKFVVDSVTYWAKNYDIDGFRFDVMNLIDSNAMKKLRSALTAIDPRIITYGEGWSMGNPNNISTSDSGQYANPNLQGIGFFNEMERMAVRADSGNTGFADGAWNASVGVADSILASGGWNGTPTLKPLMTPSQSVNYIECHDNKSLADTFWANHPDDSQATHAARINLANAINLLSDGISFMETGQEYGQSKLVNPDGSYATPQSLNGKAWQSASWAVAANSYNGAMGQDANGTYYGNIGIFSQPTMYYVGDSANQMNWDNVKTYQANVDFISQVTAFKKAHPSIWPDSYATIFGANSPLKVTYAQKGVVICQLTDGTAKFEVIFNASGSNVTVGKADVYGSPDLTGASIVTTSDSSQSAGENIAASSLSLQNLTATIIQTAK